MNKKEQRKTNKVESSGSCLTIEQISSNPDSRMGYLLNSDGVLFVFGNDWLYGEERQKNDRHAESADSQHIVSQFKDLKFHTAIVFPGIKGLGDGCFNSCHGLKRLVVHDQGLFIHTHCAEDTPLHQMLQKNLPSLDGLDHQEILSKLNSTWSSLDLDE